jgi:hypothetical protein
MTEEQHDQPEQPEQPEQPRPRTITLDLTVPDLYTDSIAIEMSSYTVTMTLGVAQGPAMRPVGIVRLSHAHAKILAIVLKRLLKKAEETVGPIQIYPSLLQERGISLEDEW